MGQSCCSDVPLVEQNTTTRSGPSAISGVSLPDQQTSIAPLISTEDSRKVEEGPRFSTLFQSPPAVDELAVDASSRALLPKDPSSKNLKNKVIMNNSGPGPTQLASWRHSTEVKIEKNIVSGWKNAILSGNDSLVAMLWEDYANSHDMDSILFGPDDESGGHKSNALMIACKVGSARIASFLLEKGLFAGNEVNDADDSGNTALHYACYARCVEAVRLLLFEYGATASLDVENGQGKLPRDIVHEREYRNKDIFKWVTELTEQRVLDSIAVSGHNSGASSVSEGYNLSPHDLDDLVEDVNIEQVRLKRKSTLNQNSEEKERERIELELYKIQKRDPLRYRALKKQMQQANGIEGAKKRQSTIGRGKTIMLEKQARLPKMEGWLEKRRPNPPRTWQKRFVQVQDGNFFWSDKERRISDVRSLKERKEFNGNVSLNVVKEVVEYEVVQRKLGKAMQNKYKHRFVLSARPPGSAAGEIREYIWQCATEKDRDFWVKGLNQHIKFVMEAAECGFVI